MASRDAPAGFSAGERPKAHFLISLLLGDEMRWGIRRPEARFADRFVMMAPYCAPRLLAVQSTFNEARRWDRRSRSKRPGAASMNEGATDDLILLA